MDEFDGRILRELRHDGRVSMTTLAARVGLSPTPVGRRVRQMEDNGIIAGYSAVIDETRIGYGFSVFVSVKLDQQVDEALATFEKAVREFPEVVDCWLMTGNRDYLMRVATADLAAFERFLMKRLAKVSCVASIESSIPLRRVKSGVSRSF